jgi:hypothetical protein
MRKRPSNKSMDTLVTWQPNGSPGNNDDVHRTIVTPSPKRKQKNQLGIFTTTTSYPLQSTPHPSAPNVYRRYRSASIDMDCTSLEEQVDKPTVREDHHGTRAPPPFGSSHYLQSQPILLFETPPASPTRNPSHQHCDYKSTHVRSSTVFGSFDDYKSMLSKHNQIRRRRNQALSSMEFETMLPYLPLSAV